jgi:cytidine/deoxycytidylate deaminase-like protein
MSYLQMATALANQRTPITPKGSSSMPRMVAILTDGKGNYFEGENSYKTHPMVARLGRNPDKECMHAEMDAIVQAAMSHTTKLGVKRNDLSSFSLEGYSMFVARVHANGRPALAKPCNECMKTIHNLGIKHLEYTR